MIFYVIKVKFKYYRKTNINKIIKVNSLIKYVALIIYINCVDINTGSIREVYGFSKVNKSLSFK